MTEQWKSVALERIQRIFRDQFLDEDLRLTETTSPDDIEEWDSLAHVNLLVAVEAAFKVRFTAEEMGNIADVSSLLAALRAKQAV
jgi:acyl carrier protein